VNPGDEIETWVWVASSANVWSPAGGNGWFLIWNVTENIASEVVTPIPSSVTFTGRSAEWVMERPKVNGRLSNLANYGTTQMIDGWAYDYANELHLYTSDDFTQLTMTNGADVLSTVTPETPTSLLFLWRNFE
jgi:Peptidase A4 family